MNRFDDARKIWATMFEGSIAEPSSQLPPEQYKKLNSIFSVGDYYYYFFNVKTAAIEFVSDGMTKLLGYSREEFNVPNLVNNIHPDDISFFLDFEATALEFLSSLPHDKLMLYKIRYDYRLKKADGSYIRILQQAVTFEQGPKGEVLIALGVHTDITHIKKEGKPTLSFIGLEGEPTYLDVPVKNKFSPTAEWLTKREKQILIYLISGRSSEEIAKVLFLSRNTVSTHRRNMLEKTNSKNTGELIAKAIKEGYV